jgi:beta-glucosidase
MQTADDEGTDEPVEALVAEMTLEEKLGRIHNHFGPLPDFSTGYAPPLERLSIPGFRMTDGPLGVRHPFRISPPGFRDLGDLTRDAFMLFVKSMSGGPSTAFPAAISQAATWEPDRAGDFGAAIASEAKAKDQHVLLAPGLNIARIPELGRNFEYYGEDPYLTSRFGVSVIEGIQSMGVVADAKHFVANNQEADRMAVSADVDERTLREIYMPAFRAAVEEAEVGSVMPGYNRLNGTYCTENEWLLTDVLREEWGFEGFVVSDWGAINDPAAAANAGTDWDGHFKVVQQESFGDELRTAVENGAVPESRVDEMVSRVLGQSDRFGVLDGEWTGPPGEVNTDAHQELARELAAEGAVLLKNEDPGLPLDAEGIDHVAVIGPGAHEAKTGGGGSSNVTTPHGAAVGPLEGIRERVDDAHVTFTPGDLRIDAEAAAAAADVAVVVATGNSTEQIDRENIHLPHGQDDLVSTVAAASDHTVVVLRTGGPVAMPWLDSVSAVLETWYPGMGDGAATAALLFGDAEPAGRLPITFGASREDYPATDEAAYPGVDRGDGYPVAEYDEGIYVGYRWFDEHGIDPLFPFGHGLAYTDFAYESIDVSGGPLREGGSVTVSCTVSNVGDRPGAEGVQAYLADVEARVDRPPKELRGFEKVHLDPGETTTVDLAFDGRDAAFYDVDRGEWVVEPGEFEVLVGRSARDVRLREGFQAVGDPGGWTSTI